MTDYLAHFCHRQYGVWMTMPMRLEVGRSTWELDKACEHIAAVLGFSFMYYEEVTP